MICRMCRTVFAALFVMASFATVTGIAYAGDRACTYAGVAGRWGMTDNGAVIGIGPRTAVGSFVLDTSGNLKDGVATSSLNGLVALEKFSGTYTLDTNCSGHISVSILDATTGTEIFAVTLNMTFDDDMRELRAIFTSVTTPDGTSLPTVINLQARKQ